MSCVDSKVADKNAWDQVRARCPRFSIERHISHTDGMGINGVETQASPRFAGLGGVGGNVEPGVAITCWRLAVRRRKLSWLSLPQRKFLVTCRPGAKASISYATGSGAHDLVMMQLPGFLKGGRWCDVFVEGVEQSLLIALAQQSLLPATEQLLGSRIGQHHNKG